MKTTTSGMVLQHGPFSEPPRQIPNSKGQPFKTEWIEVRSPQYTRKYNWWHLPDDDRLPHNHPWPFQSTILYGGYTEMRYWLEDGQVKREQRTYRQGDVNDMPIDVFHVVTEVMPGTVTRMECFEATEGNRWGYLDAATGVYADAEKEPDFMGRLWALNEWLRPTPAEPAEEEGYGWDPLSREDLNYYLGKENK